MNRLSATLIFDIGKTTKKALLFDTACQVVEELNETFPNIADEDGYPCEDLQAVGNWVKQILETKARQSDIRIDHVNFSAYGASLVYLDNSNEIIAPLYNYLKPFPDDVKKAFFASYDMSGILTSTASPFLGMLNSGLQMFWLKQRRNELFTRIHTALHLPQYFSWMITGKKYNEITSLGCHTMLWDFEKQDYHRWVHHEQLVKLFPPIISPAHTETCLSPGSRFNIGPGVHDSSAALMPFLRTVENPFLLLSTGTWNICFNPYNESPLTKEELAKDCLCYMTYAAKPVKASRIFLGHEHEVQQKALADYFQVAQDEYKNVKFNASVFYRLQDNNREAKTFYPLSIQPPCMPDTRPRQTDYSAFADFEEAQHQLMCDLVRWQINSIQLVDPDLTVKQIIVVGGFNRNNMFIEVLKRLMPTRKVLLSDHPRASALGACWLVNPVHAEKGREILNLYEA